MRHIIYSENAPKPIGPYSQAVQAGNTYYFSGQIGLDPTNGLFDSDVDVEVQTKRVMSNISALLTAAGLDWNHVVKSSIFLKDMNDFPKVNAIYGSVFTEGNYPARETVQVSRLPKDALVEISIICVK
ncbi:MAG: RidA family protein [Bacteroidia bacterium]|jgi:2-iminobutanoate/2-iminopropanoate deaminase|nr:RidA family protein [Bacteroidia bacterium]